MTGSVTSTTRSSNLIVASLPLSAAIFSARPSLNVAVACLARFEPVLDRFGKLRLPGVVGDLPVDTRGELLVLGPDRLDQRLALGLTVDEQADPAGQHLVAN